MALSSEQQLELQTQLQRAVVECSERCLYFAAKWYVEGKAPVIETTNAAD
jgi:anaphase-promoting complex subunit 8